jgi:hypothetical protein
MIKVENFIGGALVDSVSAATMALVDPITGGHGSRGESRSQIDGSDPASAGQEEILRRLVLGDRENPKGRRQLRLRRRAGVEPLWRSHEHRSA